MVRRQHVRSLFGFMLNARGERRLARAETKRLQRHVGAKEKLAKLHAAFREGLASRGGMPLQERLKEILQLQSKRPEISEKLERALLQYWGGEFSQS